MNMDAVVFLKEKERMANSDPKLYGSEMMMTNKTFEEQVQFVEQWVKEHPRKTRMQDFLEKFPNASKTASGSPAVCAAAIGYRKQCEFRKENVNCDKCWNHSVED